jgi:hypothetical protein
MDMHPYEKLSLFTVGLILGVWLIGLHAIMLWKPLETQKFLKKFPRDPLMGQLILGIGLGWFWLLIAPSGWGVLSALQMDFGDFNAAKPILRVLVPISLVLVSMSVRDFLAVRALGLLGLMAAAPLLEAAFLKDPSSRLLVPIFAYAMITVSLFWVGKPYIFRDWVNWVTADQRRWKLLSFCGLVYGIATVVCAMSYWRGY